MKQSSILRAFSFVLLASTVAAQESQPTDRAHTWTLRGRTIDEHGDPIARAGVLLIGRSEMTTQAALEHPTTRSNDDGQFELVWTSPKSGPTRESLLIAAPGRASAFWTSSSSGGNSPTRAKVLDLGAVVLPPGVTITGRVRQKNGEPLAGARVEATDPLATYYGSEPPSDFTFTCFATTDDKGAFVLPAVVRFGAALSVVAKGYYRVDVPFVATSDPAVIDLERSGVIEGRVIDADRNSIAASVIVQYESSTDFRELEETAEDGSFSLNLDHPHRYRVAAFVRHTWRKSPILSAPVSGLELRPPSLVVDGPAISVRAYDAESGATLENVQAGATWLRTHLWDPLAEYVERGAPLEFRHSDQIRLPGPREDESSTGLVVVEAEGYVPAVFSDVAWDPDDPPVLEAKLDREAVVSGTVVDEASGEPVEHAHVDVADTSTLDDWNRQEPGWLGPASNAEGKFRIGGLPAGEHTLHAYSGSRPFSEPVQVTLARGQQCDGVKLVIPRGASLHGKLVGFEVGHGWYVRLYRTDPSEGFGVENPTGRVDADGSFTIEGLARGNYQLSLFIPPPDMRGSPLEIPLEIVRLRTSDLRREFDISEDLPGVIRGTVRVAGAPLGSERLAVCVEPAPDVQTVPRGQLFARSDSSRLLTTPVGRDGYYELDALAGDHVLSVIDLATGVVLGRAADTIAVRSKTGVKVDVDLELTTVHVRLRPEDEKRDFAAALLEIDVQEPNGDGGTSWTKTPGVSLAAGIREVTLYLPALPTTLRVVSNWNSLAKEGWVTLGGGQPLAEQELTPSLEEVNEVVLTVKSPEPGPK